jgi:Cu(I)/Ag(I) efflux system membrane fusion protein
MSDTTQTSGRRFPRSILAGLLIGALLGGGGVYVALALSQAHPESAAAGAPLRYHCPMHPGYTSDGPGKCPICGMDLVPIDRSDAEQPRSASPEARGGGTVGEQTVAGERKIAFYRSPMDPKVTSPVAAKDEMGMDFVPVYEEELSGRSTRVEGLATVTLDRQRQQLIGVRLADVEQGTLSGGFRTTGRVAIDETRVRKVNVKVPGYVEKVYADFVGRPVTRGQPLFSIYSPEMVAVQNEYLLALRTRKALAGKGALAGTGDDMVAAALEHIAHWDIPGSIIRQLERTGEPVRTIPVMAPISGVVTAKTVVEGASLNPGDTPYEITDLSAVWVQADVYESELARVGRGTPAEVAFKAFPGRIFKGKVSFLDPLMDPKTRTVRVRIEVPNPDGDLRPEMFGEVQLLTGTRRALHIPFDAVVDSGERKVVFVALDGGKFQPREVQTGIRGGERIEIVSGLEAGEKVVTRASFLIDSESRLRSALASLGGKSP